MSPTILVTGGSGYLGSILCEHLLNAGYRVVVVDNLLYSQQSLCHLCSHPSFDFVLGDVRDEGLMRPLIANADVVIPLAAVVGASACDRDPRLAQSVNVDAIRMLTTIRCPRQLIIFPTTNSGYGTQSGEVYSTEETPLEPITLYGRTKVDAEALVLDCPNTIALRLATVFGMSPRMRRDLLVNHFVHAAVTDGYLVLFEKHFKRNFIHIRDVADCFLHCLSHADAMTGRSYNVGLDTANISKEELALKVKTHVPSFYIHYAEIGSDPDKRNYVVDNSRLRTSGFEAKRSLDDGIRELIKGYRLVVRSPMKNG